jgi:hypothetical protein
MGIFSKPKSKDTSGVPKDGLLGFISKFQKMLPDDFIMEINGKTYDTHKLREIVDTLTRISSRVEDEQLLTFVARACVVASDEFGTFEVAEIAETLFDDLGKSGEIRRRYASNQSVIDGVIALGCASISILEKNPKYPAVLEYISANAEKLGSR